MYLAKNEFVKFTQTYKKILFYYAGLAFIVILGTYFTMMAIGQETIDQFMEGVVDSLGGEQAIHEKMKSQNSSFLFILQNNLKVSLIVLISGLIPFYFVTLIGLPSIAIIGVVLANAKMDEENPFWVFCTSILPNGITEFTEFLIVVSMSIYLSHTITKKIFNRKSEILIWQQVKANLMTFLVVCVPLVVLSAAIEAFITPILMR